MQPTPKDAHKDSFLSGLSVGYKNPMFVADMVFPNVPVNKQSDYYFKFLKGAWFRNEAEIRSPGAIAARGGYPVTSALYGCQERAFAHPVPIELINNADDGVRPFETGTRFVTQKIMLAKEIAVAANAPDTIQMTIEQTAIARFSFISAKFECCLGRLRTRCCP